MIDQVRQVLDNLGTQFPEWAGLGYQIAGFGWHQGWNDSSHWNNNGETFFLIGDSMGHGMVGLLTPQ